MIIKDILTNCDQRYEKHHSHKQCENCTYGQYCPHDCAKCLDFIHNPRHAEGAPDRKYDCTHMADMYTCKYSCRYTSEIIYALQQCENLCNIDDLKILSFGCGPCTDLFAIDYLREKRFLNNRHIHYIGIDYSQDVWKYIHQDILNKMDDRLDVEFRYKDLCIIIDEIEKLDWLPNLIVFQYVLSDMRKHTDDNNTSTFFRKFAEYYNKNILPNTYVILNDINLSCKYGGGREYFDRLSNKLNNSKVIKGRFCDDNAKSINYPRGYNYGDDSVGEFKSNENLFDLLPWKKYSPFNTCASAQMIITKV